MLSVVLVYCTEGRDQKFRKSLTNLKPLQGYILIQGFPKLSIPSPYTHPLGIGLVLGAIRSILHLFILRKWICRKD